ncbi:MAG: hypothetical protein ACK55I_21335, partial [bacterium]
MLLFLVHDKQRRLLHRVRHEHVVVRRRGLDAIHLRLKVLRLLFEVLRLLLREVLDLLFERGDLTTCLFHRLPQRVIHRRHFGKLHGRKH